MTKSKVLIISRALWHPAVITGVISTLLVAIVLLVNGFDPLALVRSGTQYSEGATGGSQGYDGQFVYYIANDLNPDTVADKLDVPAYRYQRILMPLMARIFGLGSPRAIAWVLPMVGICAQFLGTFSLAKVMRSFGSNHWYSLIYGTWAGLLLSIRLDLPEPLAFALVCAGVLASLSRRQIVEGLCYCAAIFAKEITILFVAAALFEAMVNKQWRRLGCIIGLAILPYAIFQLWLWRVFGAIGIGSGGDMATGFEYIPFWGLLRIGEYSMLYLVAMMIVFGPTVILPSIWGVWAFVGRALKKEANMVGLALLLNALVMWFIPFSTYRETGGLLRFASGLVLSVLLYAARYHNRRVLKYATFWVVLNTFLVKA